MPEPTGSGWPPVGRGPVGLLRAAWSPYTPMERSAWYVYLQPSFDEVLFVARCSSKRDADRLVGLLRLHLLQGTGRECLVRAERIGGSRARRHAVDERVRASQARALAGERSLDAIAARAALSADAAGAGRKQGGHAVMTGETATQDGMSLGSGAGRDRPQAPSPGTGSVRPSRSPGESAAATGAPADGGDFRPAACFPKGMAARLRMAASRSRKTKRVATRVIDGVVCYSVADVMRWWPHDLRSQPLVSAVRMQDPPNGRPGS